MKKNGFISNILTLALFSGMSGVLIADDQLQQEEEAASSDNDEESEKVVLDSMLISASRVDEAFKKTTLIKDKLGTAGDGADFLKKTAGISVIRQGGAASDPLLRGLGGTRLNISLDGVPFGGVCNHRMDPATAYVKPGTFDAMSILKGPQSVRYGNSLAGTVNFDRSEIIYDELGVRGDASYYYGSFSQQDLTVNSSAGFKYGYVAYTHNNARSDNYENGDGEVIDLTFKDTANDRLAFGYRPDDDTLLEVSAVLSEGKMGNATIHMDVTRLDRQSYDVHFKKENINPWLKTLDIRYNFTEVDHAMDNYTLRQHHGSFVVMGQYWEKHYAKIESTIDLSEEIELIVGMDYKNERYDANAAGGRWGLHYRPADISDEEKNRILDFDNFAAYAELSYQQNDQLRWVAGLRGDTLGTDSGTMHGAGEVGRNVLKGANRHRRETLMAGFLRAEYNFDDLPLQLSAGYGHAEKAPDYWDVYSYDGLQPKFGTKSGFEVDPERNDEVDLELSYGSEKFMAKLSGFYSYMSNYLLLSGTGTGFDGKRVLIANRDVHRVGGELNVSYNLTDSLAVFGDVSYVYGKNITDDAPLAQTPPLEGNIGLSYQQGPFSGAISTRLVNAQTRIHEGYGNALAVDSTVSPGFVTASLELGYKPHEIVDIKFGIENLFNKTYSEHISRSTAANVAGSSNLKIHEPGRTIWARVSISLDSIDFK